jgi:hypothetical protein
MSKINKKSMNYGFKILTLLAFSLLIIPTQASAERSGYVTPYNSTDFNRVYKSPDYNYNYGYDYNSPAYYQPYQPFHYAYISPTPAATPTVYSSSANPNGNAGTSSGTANSSNAANTGTGSANNGAVNNTDDNLSNLAASAVYGSSDGFLPSGLMQWIMVAIFILLIVILARRIFGMKENYETTPLKHA